MSITLLAVLGLFLVSVASEIPADWAGRHQLGHLLYSPVPTTGTLNATVGNGYVATSVYSDTIYISGLFNGDSDVTPSHRARIPGYTAVEYTAPGEVIGFALDLQMGVFMKRTKAGTAGVLEQKIYAHRKRHRIIVVEFSLIGAPFANLTLSVHPGAPSTDIDFTYISAGRTILQKGETKLPEENSLPRITTVVAQDVIPGHLLLKDGEKKAFIFSFATSMEGTPSALAMAALEEARHLSCDTLFSEHILEWMTLSASGSFVKNNLELALAVNSSNYYILSSIRDDWPWSLSPGGLASNSYNGHTFWDCETWMYPSILPFHPEIANSILEYRYLTRQGAERKARSYNPPYAGAMFAWESAFSGEETCPRGIGTCTREIHISGDIAFAAWQYYSMTGDDQWKRNEGLELVTKIADFWASRATPDGKNINNVIPPDEYHDHVNNSAYTNAVAIFSLELATQWSKEEGRTPSAAWSFVARNLVLPYDTAHKLYMEYDGYTDEKIKQADVILLAFPLGWKLDEVETKAMLDFYTPKTDVNGPAMTWAMTVIGYLQINLPDEGNKFFPHSFANIHPPFNVWYETPQGGAVNFITGAGGFLQLMTYGYSGMRIHTDGLNFLNYPHLPPNTDEFSLVGIKYLGNTLDFYFDSSQVEIYSDEKGVPLVARDEKLSFSKATIIKRDGTAFTVRKA